MSVLARDFYSRETTLVARDLLGKLLLRRARDGVTVGRIVEVEAYLHVDDAACHAVRGRTTSNQAMFGPPGRAYVYPIHARYCFNTVTRQRGVPSAILVRAVEPLSGIRLMEQRRGCQVIRDLARGPARLCQAFAIDRHLDHWDLTQGRRLWLEEERQIQPPFSIGRSVRIGVTAAHDLPLRFFAVGNAFVSGPRKLKASPTK